MPLVAVAVVPCAPLILPEVTGPETGDLAPMRKAVAAAVAAVVTAVVTAPGGQAADRVVVAARAERGTLSGIGAPIPGIDGAGGSGWAHELGRILLARAGFPGEVEDLVLADAAAGDDAATVAKAAAATAQLHEGGGATALLVLADGSATRGPRAPAGEDHRGDEVDAAIVASLASGEIPAVDPVLALALQVRGLPGFAAAVTAAREAGLGWTVLHVGAPAGVGYVVALAGAGEAVSGTTEGRRP